MQPVDPEIVKRMILPSGPSGQYTEEFPSLSWDYAIVMDARIKDMEALVQFRHLPHELRSKMQNFYDEFRHSIGNMNYMTGLFENIFKTALPENQSSKHFSKDIVQAMRAALDEDVKELGEFPSDRFANLQQYMEHEACKMADDMEMKAFNSFDKLQNLHNSYVDHKRRGGHVNAMAQLKQSPQYWDMVQHLTLLDKIHKLEMQNKAVVASLMDRIDALEAAQTQDNARKRHC